MSPRPAATGPLAGTRVVVTRAEGPGGPLSRRLAERGAEVLNWPVLAFEPAEDPTALEEALARLEDYDWILFTSPRAVSAVAERRARPPVGRPRVAAVGGSTAECLRSAGWPVELEALPASGEGLLRAFEGIGCNGARMLFPASSIARDTLRRGLEARGATIEQLTAYRTVPVALDTVRCLAALEEGDPPILTFASPSAVSGLAAALRGEQLEALLGRCPAVVIGKTTGRALSATGFSPTLTAASSTLAGLADAVEQVAQEARTG